MPALPYMRINLAEHLAETAHLSAAEYGAYMLLAMNYWQRGQPFRAQNKDRLKLKLARISRLSLAEFDVIRPAIEEFFVISETEWRHTQIDDVLSNSAKATLRPSAEVWAKIRSRIFERDDYTCQYCGVRGVKLECDHVVPVSRGGSNDDDNLKTACRDCNRSKRDKLIDEWMGV